MVEIVDDFRGVRQEFADPGAGLSVLLEFEDGARYGEGALARGHAGDALAHAHAAGQFGAGEFVERRFVIEEIHLGWAARLVEEDDAFGFGREMGKSRKASGRAGFGRGGEAVL